MYGQLRENEEETSCDESSDSLDKMVPLLQEKMEVWIELRKILEAEEFTYFSESSSLSFDSFQTIVIQIQVSPMLQIF